MESEYWALLIYPQYLQQIFIGVWMVYFNIEIEIFDAEINDLIHLFPTPEGLNFIGVWMVLSCRYVYPFYWQYKWSSQSLHHSRFVKWEIHGIWATALINAFLCDLSSSIIAFVLSRQRICYYWNNLNTSLLNTISIVSEKQLHFADHQN